MSTAEISRDIEVHYFLPFRIETLSQRDLLKKPLSPHARQLQFKH